MGRSWGTHQILQVLADRLRIAEVVVLLNQAVEKAFPRRPPNLLKMQRPDPRQFTVERNTIDVGPYRLGSLGQRIGRDLPPAG